MFCHHGLLTFDRKWQLHYIEHRSLKKKQEVRSVYALGDGMGIEVLQMLDIPAPR